MKNFKLLPIVLFASAITLASCNFLGGSTSSKKKSKKSSTGDTTQVTSGESSSSKSSSSGGKSSSSGGSSSGGSSSSGSSSSSSSSSGGGETSYTLDGVAADINAAFSSILGGSDLLEYNATDSRWEGGANVGSGTDPQSAESVLKPIVDLFVSYMPTYLTKVYSHFWTSEEDYWEDESGDTVYEEAYDTPKSEVEVDIIGYCYNSKLIGQVLVYVPTNS